MERRNTRTVQIGKLAIGSGHSIRIQSMTFTKTSDRQATLAQILELERAGCDIVRFSVPDMDSVKSIPYFKQHTAVPLVADIHFNYRLAVECAAAGIDKIRINPGNIGDETKVKQVVMACRQRGIPIRVGVNGGSLEKDLLAKYGRATSMALCESALSHVALLEKYDFYDTVVSIKSSDVVDTIEANELFAAKTDYPLHLGVTEAGTERMGLIRSAAGIGALLCQGLGDTIRVSLSADVIKEVQAAKDLLSALGMRKGIQIVSCPTCARRNLDVISIAESLEAELKDSDINMKIAVMGCEVNGPGEARDADLGIAGGKDCALLFRRGKILRKVPKEDAKQAILDELSLMEEDHQV